MYDGTRSAHRIRNRPTAWADSTDSIYRGGALISATTMTSFACKLVLSSLEHCATLLLRYLSIFLLI